MNRGYDDTYGIPHIYLFLVCLMITSAFSNLLGMVKLRCHSAQFYADMVGGFTSWFPFRASMASERQELYRNTSPSLVWVEVSRETQLKYYQICFEQEREEVLIIYSIPTNLFNIESFFFLPS